MTFRDRLVAAAKFYDRTLEEQIEIQIQESIRRQRDRVAFEEMERWRLMQEREKCLQ